ncbi:MULTISPECIES: hypothetical protein [Pseudanabaena]|uniref:NurA domain-containing protein n=2 Tax=Pseudanabaena TaxID=1152 RepID=L8MZS2_9CYAN|nr:MULTISPECIES: hypothetical protein [Pseudanabaena]ELS31990.1 hypothetical protein Pse7429DRAFT_2772 [Pseudanabaena biceps PCC 7429]MDG3495759.1 hypothetical protein [Pseudanabaena catenata USMAC16]
MVTNLVKPTVESFWNEYNIRLEPWSIGYDAPVSINPEEIPTNDKINTEVEVSNAQWQPIRAAIAPELPNQILFIDGRLRLDARFLGRSDDEILYGAFATIAVGAVLVDRVKSRAKCIATEIKRIIAMGGNLTAPPTVIPCPISGRGDLKYDYCLTNSNNEPDTPSQIVQSAMLDEELRIANELSLNKELIHEDTLIVRDGPLLYRVYQTPFATIGYVKTMGKAYLKGENAQIMRSLKVGERTPIFRIANTHGSNLSWYLRSGSKDLNYKKLGYHDLHGIIRIDLDGGLDLAHAKAIADQSTYLIPQYASHPSRDPRAPQNLTPVGALEKELGRRMGSRELISRRLRDFLAKSAINSL